MPRKACVWGPADPRWLEKVQTIRGEWNEDEGDRFLPQYRQSPQCPGPSEYPQHKMGLQHSSPLLWSLSITTFMAVGFLLLLRSVPWKDHPFPHGRTLMVLLLIGVFQGLVLLVQNHALLSGPVPSIIALKRSSILFAVIWGIMFLRESHSRERLAGAMLMITGIITLGMGSSG